MHLCADNLFPFHLCDLSQTPIGIWTHTAHMRGGQQGHWAIPPPKQLEQWGGQ